MVGESEEWEEWGVVGRVVGRVVSGGLVNVLDVLEGQLDQHHQEDQQGPMNGGHNIG